MNIESTEEIKKNHCSGQAMVLRTKKNYDEFPMDTRGYCRCNSYHTTPSKALRLQLSPRSNYG